MKRYRAGILGATGMVGQRLVTLLAGHPWFEVTALAASAQSAGQPYRQAVAGRWQMPDPIPPAVGDINVMDAMDLQAVAQEADLVFCAVSLDKASTRALEEAYARLEVAVISNNSACRGIRDVPMLIPEINPEHARVIPAQRKRLGTQRGFIAVKPNCSIQSYVPALTPLRDFGIRAITACTYQAVSGAGKTLDNWPQMQGNIIPYIAGEEEKSEQEPLKIWGSLSPDADTILPGKYPVISAQCVRVPVSDGHLAAVSVKFDKKPTREEILARWRNNETLPQKLQLPSAPVPFLRYLSQEDRPQPLLDRGAGNGMAVVIGRLREDPVMDWRFVCLSHNTLRGAAGGSVLTAELLCAQGYILHRE